MSRQIPIDRVDRFDYHRLHFERYNINNMLMKQANFPSYVLEGQDRFNCIWSDRLTVAWNQTMREIRAPKGTGYDSETFWSSLEESELIKFAQLLDNAFSEPMKVTGAAIIRFSRNGYPLYCLQYVQQAPGDRPMGIPLTAKGIAEERMMDSMGRVYA